MPTKRPPKELDYLTKPPRGMWYEHHADKSEPFYARWRMPDGSKPGRGFPDAEKRAAFAGDWLRQRQEFGKAAKLVDAHTVGMWAQFRELTGDAHPLTVAREWLAFRGTNSAISIADGWAEFNADQEKRNLSGDTHSHRRLHGQRLCAFLKGKTAASVRSEDLDAWLASMNDHGAKSKTHHLKNARHFFEWLKDRRKIPHNPADAVTIPDKTVIGPDGQPVHRDINILTVEEVRKLFEANRAHACVGRLAAECFGGLRFTSAKRLKAPDIAWDDRGITMPGHQHKSGMRHYVDGWPDALWAWMKAAPAECWAMEERTYQTAKLLAFARADVVLTHNCLRHSFASYHLAGFKDARLTSHLMTKTSITSLNNDYRGRATKAQADAFFQILP